MLQNQIYGPSRQRKPNSLTGIYLLLFLGALLFPGFVQAQSGTCSWLSDFCVDIRAKSPGQAPNQQGCPVLNCDEMIYEVYIKNCNTSAFYATFDYNWFTILGKVVITSGSGYVDANKSMTPCSPSYAPDAFSVEPDGSVAFQLGQPLQCSETQYPGDLGQTIPLVNGEALLFSVVVHAGPGAVVTWKNPSVGANPYLSVYGKYCPQSCAGTMNVTYDGGASPQFVMPAGSACSFPLNFNFGNTPVSQTFPGNVFNPVAIPLYLSGLPNGTVIDEIEAVLEIKTSNYMEYGNTVGDLIPCQSILNPSSCDIRERYYESGGDKYRELTGHSYNVTYSGTGLLFTTYLLGPFNESIGDCAEVTVKYIRIKIGGNCCLVQPSANQGISICFTGYPPCPEFNLAVIEEPISQTDCDLDYTVKLSWTYLQQSFFFERLNFDLVFVSEVPLEPSTIYNSICPGDGCITITNTGTNKWVVSCNLGNTFVTKNSYFTLRFSGLQGCVKGYLFSRSELKVANGDYCVPSLSPQYTTGNYTPRCFARLGGTVTYKASSMCDEFDIRAIPDSGDPNCKFEQTLIDGESSFSFCACQSDFPYRVTCQKTLNSNDLCGVSTYDLVLINRHILGVEYFDETFKEVAADVDCSGQLTITDVAELRKLILGIYTKLPKAPSFKILPSIPPHLPQAPGAYCQEIAVKNVMNPSASLDFYVVKTGDVNYNCPSSGCLVSNGNNRENSIITLRLNQPLRKRGDKVRIPVCIDVNQELSAIQMTLQFNPSHLSIQGIIPGDFRAGISEHNLHTEIAKNGELRWLWHEDAGIKNAFRSGQTLFYIDAFALEDLNGQEIALDPYGDMPSLAYDGAGLEFSLVDRTELKYFEVRAVPNPFDSAVDIQFEMSEQEAVTIKVFNALGALLFEEKGILAVGLQEKRLDDRIFRNSRGVYYVTVETTTAVQTLRLVKQ